jgi:hypothetical protein
MAINMNQIDFEEIRKRKDQVRGSQQAQERRLQSQRDRADADLQKRKAETDKDLQASRQQGELTLRDIIEKAQNQRAAQREQSQMDRLALAAALQMTGEGGKLPEGFDYQNIGDLLHLAGAAGTAARGEKRMQDILGHISMVDPVTGEARSSEDIQRQITDQLSAYRQSAGESDPIQDMIDAFKGSQGTQAPAPEQGKTAPGGTPSKSRGASGGWGEPAPAAKPTARPSAAPRPGHSPLFRTGAAPQAAAAPAAPAAAPPAPATAPAMSLADYVNSFTMPPMVDGQPTGAPAQMPAMVDGRPYRPGSGAGSISLPALIGSLARGNSQAQASQTRTPTGLPQLNPNVPALNLPDVVDGRPI